MKELLKELGFEHLPMLSEFVWSIQTQWAYGDWLYKTTLDYRNFITQPLTKGMFIPCGEDGEVLKEPKDFVYRIEYGESYDSTKCDEYQQAMDRVLFENTKDAFFECMSEKFTPDFEDKEVYTIDNGSFYNYYYTIEQAINNGVKLKLK